MALRPTASPAPPTFFLDEIPEGPGGRARIRGEETAHARVLRLRPGDRCSGLDGAGGRWFLRVISASSGELEVQAEAPPELEPAPGEPGASLPWVELAISWPRKNRAAAMLGSLVQLGVAAIAPLHARQRGAEPCPDLDGPRWTKLAREAMKQCGRTWLPELGRALAPEDLPAQRPGATLALLDPGSGMSFDTWLRSLQPSPLGIGNRERPILLAIGPEGGFTAEEREALLAAGASSVWLGPHVLRIETAASAAMALAGCTLGSPSHGRR